MSEEIDNIALQRLQEAMGSKPDGDDLASMALLASVRIQRLQSVVSEQDKEIKRLNGILDQVYETLLRVDKKLGRVIERSTDMIQRYESARNLVYSVANMEKEYGEIAELCSDWIANDLGVKDERS